VAKKGKTRWIIGGTVIALAVVGIAVNNMVGQNLVYFYTPSEAYAKSAELDGQTVKVGGMVKQGTVKWQPEQLALSFTMTDLQGHDIDVKHNGTPPDMFKEGQGVVVEGRLENGGKNMVSHNLLVKHSEEYKGPGKDHATMDKALLEKSLFKGQQEEANK
jgi:cytochrome c-type biogenesis protein CcmE